MAANSISQLSTANTFQHWLTATQSLVGTVNLLTAGEGDTFYANTKLEVGGTNATLNVVTSASINQLYANTVNIGNVSITGNVAYANVTGKLNVGQAANLYSTLEVFGHTTLHTSNIADLTVTNTATVLNTTIENADIRNANVEILDATSGTLDTLQVTNSNTATANIGTITGPAVNQFDAAGRAIIFSIALG